MEILKNLAEAINERYIVARRSRYSISVTPRKSYQYYLRLISRALRHNINYWYNHVAGVAPVENSQYFTNWDISWNLVDMLADIGDAEFHDYDEGWHPRVGGGGRNIGFDSYRDRMDVLRQYYEIIIRMKEVVLNLSGVYSEGGKEFFHPWRDKGVYSLVSVESSSTRTKNGSRDYIIQSEGLYGGSSPTHVKFIWPQSANYNTTNQPRDTDHTNLYGNLYQWFPVQAEGLDFITATGSFPSGPFFGKGHEVRFRARAVGDDGTFPGPDIRKDSQDVQYQRHNITLNYFENKGMFASLAGMPKKVKYFYHCVKEPGPNDLGCPFQEGTSYYEAELDESLSINFLFGENTNRPGNVDIPMIFGQGVHQPWNGYRLIDSLSGHYMVEVWDDGEEGGLEYY